MPVPNTPYTPMLEGRDPIVAMPDTIARMAAVVEHWTPEQFERPVAPGKWTARQVLMHLAQTEMALGTRARMALTSPGYAAQSFDQDRWLDLESGMSGIDALHAFTAIGSLNAALYAGLSDDARQTVLTHSEYGSMTVDWVIYQEAGHQLHHLRQLESLVP